MVNKKLQHFNKYLIVTAVFAVVALASYSYYLNTQSKEIYHEDTVQNFERVSAELHQEIITFKSKLKNLGSINFSDLPVNTAFPIRVYRNDTLVYWSDSRYVIDYSSIAGYYTQKCTESGAYLYYVRKSRLQYNEDDLQVVGLLPLKNTATGPLSFEVENYYQRIFKSANIELTLVEKKEWNVYNRFNDFLFSIIYPENFYYTHWSLWLSLACSLSTLLLLAWHLLQRLFSKNSFSIKKGLLLLLLVFTALYLVIHFLASSNLSNQLFEDRDVEVLSSITKRLLLISLPVVMLLYIGSVKKNLIKLRAIYNVDNRLLFLVLTVAIALSFYLPHFLKWLLNISYFNNGILLDITQILQLNAQVLVVHITYFVGLLFLFLACNLVAVMVLRLTDSFWHMLGTFLGGALFYLVLSFVFNNLDLPLFNIHLAYFGIILMFGLPIRYTKNAYIATFYGVLCAVVGALTAALVFNDIHSQSGTLQKKRFVSEVLESNVLEEIYLKETTVKIKQDSVLIRLFAADNEEAVSARVRKLHLFPYFDQYELEVSLLPTPAPNKDLLAQVLSVYPNLQESTLSERIFKTRNYSEGFKNYLATVELNSKNEKIGWLFVKLNLKKVDKFNFRNPSKNDLLANRLGNKGYSFAFYRSGQLEYSYGEYPYNQVIRDNFDGELLLRQSQFTQNGYDHLRLVREPDTEIIVSSAEYPFYNLLSNFSFFFLTLVFLMLALFIVLMRVLRIEERFARSFSTRIQLYLNLAFFIPLVVLSGLVINFLGQADKAETNSDYLDKGNTLANYLYNEIIDYKAGNLPLAQLQIVLKEAAELIQADVNVYSDKGQLIATSQPQLFDIELAPPLPEPCGSSQVIRAATAKANGNRKTI